MGLEQAPHNTEQIDAPSETPKLRDTLPVETLAGSMDFTPRPTKVADMDTVATSNQAPDAKQYLYFGGDIYGQSKKRADAPREKDR